MMRKRITALLLLSLLSVSYGFSQAAMSPVDIAKKIFGKTEFKDIDAYSTGEYQGHPNGSDLGPNVKATFMLLGETADKAVVAMNLVDSLGQGIDTYLHFAKEDKIWKMKAFRALAMTGMIEAVAREMEGMSSKTVDSLIAVAKKDTVDHGFPKTRADFDFELGNAKLTIAMDKDLIAHFNMNKAAFEKLKAATLSQKGLSVESILDSVGTAKEDKAYTTLRKSLFISSSYVGEYGTGTVSFTIGGILDNTVGYLYIPDKKNIPDMTPDKIIMVREIGGGWYLFKTT